MTQALAELRAPVDHEALRLRMVALHGREDALLDAAPVPAGCSARPTTPRSPTCGRWARTSTRSRRTARRPCRPSRRPAAGPSRRRSSPPPPSPADAAAEPARDNGQPQQQRLGVRFRRGSRGPLRAGEIPLIGVVQIDAPAAAEVAVAADEAVEAVPEPAAKKPARPRRAPGRRTPAAAAAKAAPVDEADGGEAAPAPKRPRTQGEEEGGVSSTRRAATLPVSFFARPAEVVARELLGTAARVLGAAAQPDGGAASWRPRPTWATTTRPRTATATAVTRRTRRCSARPARGTSTSPTACTGAPTWSVAPAGAGERGAAPGARAGARAGDHAASGAAGWPTASSARARASSARRWASPGTWTGPAMRALGRRWSRAGPSSPGRRGTPRIGITKAADWPLRFVVDGSPWVSRSLAPIVG